MTNRPRFDDRFEILGGLAYRVAYRLLGDREEAREASLGAAGALYVERRDAAIDRVVVGAAVEPPAGDPGIGPC